MIHSRSRLLGVAFVAATVVSAVAVGPSAAGEPPGIDPGSRNGPAAAVLAATGRANAGLAGEDDSAHTITLITGDVVHYSDDAEGPPTVTVDPAPRATGAEIGFHSFPTSDGFVVIPEDAVGLVAAGRLDQSLFDVPTLVEEQAGQPDGEIPVLIEHPGVALDTHADVTTLTATDDVQTLDSIDATALDVHAGQAQEFWAALTTGDAATADPAGRARTQTPAQPGLLAPGAPAESAATVWLDRTVTAALDESVPQIGAPAAWDLGLDGTGVKVAVLDTGIDPNHPDVADQVVAMADFTGKGEATDGAGHGTHVAGITLGDGSASDGRFTGVAPGADLLVGKVLNDSGSGSMSQIIAGMEWAVAQGADIVNMSLSANGGPTDGTDPMSRALDTLAESGDTLFVVAAGNSGQARTVGSPGAASRALTVGAVDDVDAMAVFSSRGPRGGDAAVKPNLVAPGVAIGSARAAGTDGQEPIDEWYTRGSGTSMASPHVAGAAALLAQQHPEWSAEDIRNALVSTATPTEAIWYAQGGGRVDVAAAVTAEVFASASVDFGRLSRTRGPSTSSVTFTNTGDDRVTLELDISDFRGFSGAPGPEGAVRVAGKKVTVPAGGTRTVRMRIDARRGDPGAYGGFLTAVSTDGDTRLSVPFSYYTGESHRVDVAGRTSDGRSENPYGTMSVLVVALNEPTSAEDPFVIESDLVLVSPALDGGVIELAPGDYQFIGMFYDVRRGRSDYVLDRVSVDGPRAVMLDAASTVPVAPSLPEPVDVGPQEAVLLLDVEGDQDPFWLRSSRASGDPGGIRVTPQSGGGLRYMAQSHADLAAVNELRTSDGRSYRPTYDSSATRRLFGDGGTYDVVSVGAGDPADYAGVDVAGKIVVIGVPLAAGDFPAHDAFYDLYPRAGMAAGMGAAGVVAYVDADGDPGRYVWQSVGVPVLALSAAEGRQLAADASDGSLSMTIDGNAEADTAYRVRVDHTGQIPVDPPVLTHDDLIRVDAAYHATGDGTTVTDSWATVTDDGFETLAPVASTLTAPTERTEYVGPAREGLSWLREVTQGSLPVRSMREYDADDHGTTRDEHWFRAPLTPGAATVPSVAVMPGTLLGPLPWSASMTPCGLCRDGDRLVPALNWLDSDPHHAADLDPQVELFSDGVAIPRADGEPASFLVPAGTAAYRLVAHDEPSGGLLPESVTTVTEFASTPLTGRPNGFTCSFGDSCTFQPAPQVRFDVPVDLRNTAPAGEPFTFDVIGSTAGGDPVEQVSVQYSTDGGSDWIEAAVSAGDGDGRFAVTVDHPALESTDGFVTLRVTATDASGNSVEQTVNRAYALR